MDIGHVLGQIVESITKFIQKGNISNKKRKRRAYETWNFHARFFRTSFYSPNAFVTIRRGLSNLPWPVSSIPTENQQTACLDAWINVDHIAQTALSLRCAVAVAVAYTV